MRRLSVAPFAFWILLLAFPASAETQSVSPYIDSIRERLRAEDTEEGEPGAPAATVEAPDPYIKKLREGFSSSEEGSTDKTSGSFIEDVKSSESYRKETEKQQAPGSFIENVKNGLEADESPGAIESFRAGQSELELKRPGEIHGAASLRYGALMARNITGSGRSFSEVYGTSYTPSLSFTYEYQPWHSEWVGSLGLQGGLGVEYTSGFGIFQFPLTNPITGLPFASDNKSKTVFGLLSMPLSVGLNYRFNLFRILRPFAAASVLAVGHVEARGDQGLGSWKRAFSVGYLVTGGVNLLLDWFSRGGAWDLYTNYGIKHTYLTVTYDMAGTFLGDVNYGVSGIQAGLTFEF